MPLPHHLPRGDLLQQESDFLVEISSAQKGLRFIQMYRS